MIVGGCLTGWRATAIAAGVALGLAACVGRIWRDEADANGLRLHWYTKEASIDEARAEAARYCRDRGKRAELRDEFTDRDVTVARFACR
jgi:hypothetical protein